MNDETTSDWRDQVVVVAVFLYPLVRFAVPQSSIAMALVIAMLAVITSVSISRISAIYVVVIFPVFGSIILTSTDAGYPQAAVYWSFICLYVVMYLRLADRPLRIDPGFVSLVAGLFALTNIVISAAGLESVVLGAQSTVDVGDDPIRSVLGNIRWRGAFVHANEAGVFFLGLTILLRKIGGHRRALLPTALAWIALIMTGSVTAIGLAAAFVAIGNRKAHWFAYVMAGLVGLGALTQLVFPGQVMELSQRGSFWWRYMMAEKIVGESELVMWAPWNVAAQANWPHSLLLDIATSFGTLVAVAAAASAMVLIVLLPPNQGKVAGVIALVSLFQPIGAMPTAILICVVAAAVQANHANGSPAIARQDRGVALRELARGTPR